MNADELKKLHKKKMVQLFEGQLLSPILIIDIKQIEKDIGEIMTLEDYAQWHIFNGVDIALSVDDEIDFPNIRLVS